MAGKEDPSISSLFIIMDHSTCSGIGIDVSKATLDVVLRFSYKEEHCVVQNNTSGINKLLCKLKGCTCRIVLESTGRYHILCAYLLAQAGYDVHLINPIAARRYITASVRKKKTDKADAAVLAHIASLEEDIPRFTATKTDIYIRQKLGLLCSLERELQSLHGILKGYVEFQDVLRLSASKAEQNIAQCIEELKKQKGILEKEIETLIHEQCHEDSWFTLARSVPGVSLFLAHLLYQVLRKDCVSAKQWIAFFGLDVSVPQSGTWRGRGKLSKRGSAYLRKRMFQAAWGAVMNSEYFRAYYDQLRAQKRSYRESINIIARKQLRILFAVWKNGMPFSADHHS